MYFKIIAEPGTHVASSAFTLLTSIVSRRKIVDNNKETVSYWYYIADSIHSSFGKLMFSTRKGKSPCIIKVSNFSKII